MGDGTYYIKVEGYLLELEDEEKLSRFYPAGFFYDYDFKNGIPKKIVSMFIPMGLPCEPREVSFCFKPLQNK